MELDPEIEWRDVHETGVLAKRLGHSIASGKLVIEIFYDRNGREIGSLRYDDDGALKKRVVYEYDEERKPKLILVYDKNSKLIWRQERGKRPEDLSS
jgi:hypothetical protein